MSRRHQDHVTRLIAEVIAEMNAKRDRHRAIPAAPDTVLLGEGGSLDSLGFVMLAVTLEAKIEQEFGASIVVMDVVLSGDTDRCTVASLGQAIAEKLDHVGAAP